jgi:uncharacterized repeat protein (TIGR03803 family)
MKIHRISIASLFLTVNLASAAPGQDFAFTNIFSFNGTNGAEPWCRLIQARDGNFYGTTYSGGGYIVGPGTIFRMTPSGDLTTLHIFDFASGYYPAAGLLQASDGNFYGTTTEAGISRTSDGIIFRMTPTGEFTNLYAFSGADGSNPWAGPLVQGRDGFLYGTTESGGSGELPGSIYQISTNGFFNSLCGLYGEDGYIPYGGLVEGSDGNFYGTMSEGGGGIAWGTVFKVTPSGAYTRLFSFNGQDGAIPFGGLVQGKDGNFYGTTTQGGPSYGDPNSVNGQGFGTIFKITTNGELTTLFNFNGTNGAYPYGPLMQGSDSRLYGVTLAGGAYTNFFPQVDSAGYGTLFQITTNGELTTLYSFDQTNGAEALGTPMQASDGSFYGTTEVGGQYNLGTIYKFTVPLPPSLYAPAAITNECGDPDTFSVAITNQTSSALTGIWSVNQQPVETNTYPPAPVTFATFNQSLPHGSNVVTLSVTDDFGNSATSSTIVIVADTQPPVITTASATPNILWPSNGRMVNVQVDAVIQDACSSATWKIISVESPGLPSGKMGRWTYWTITGDHTVSLRAQRGPGGRDRVYQITIQATNESGMASQLRVVTVTVPKSPPRVKITAITASTSQPSPISR